MSREEIIKIVNGFLIDEFEMEESALDPNAVLQEALDLDSLDYVDLVVVIESNFGFKVTGEDFQNIKTLGDFYDLLVEKKKTVDV